MPTSTGLTALVTGASAGLGREYARLFAADGHQLVLVARGADRLREVANELTAQHLAAAQVLPADLADPAAPARIVETLEREGTNIDFLVNNAGFGLNGPFAELDPRRQLELIQVNVAALTELTRLALPGMIARRRGRILNVASTAAFQPGPGMAVYFASKAFVLSFSEAIAHELRGTGVTVTCHCPGATATEFAQKSQIAESNLFKAGVADAPAVARHGYRAMMTGRVLSIPGSVNWLGAQSVRFSPRPIVRTLTAWVNSK
jgi:uncharacterized protein